MKRLLYFIAALCLVACEPNTPENPQTDSNTLNKSQLVGVWATSFKDKDTIPAPLVTDLYIQFNENGTFESLRKYVGDVTYYICELGTYSVNDTTITLTYQNVRDYFYQNKILRIACYYAISDLLPVSYDPTRNYSVLNVTKDKISTTISDSPYYFYRLLAKPDMWDARFFEPEKEVTEEALIAQWDLANYFTQSSESYAWWYYNKPSYEGIQLLADGKMVYDYFWAGLLWNMLIAEGAITDQQGIGTVQEDCRWSLHDKTITMTCSKYALYNYNGSDYEFEKEVIPETPITADLTVFAFTDYFMILHCDFDDRYYVFEPGSASAKSAEKHVRYVPAKATKIAKEPGHMLLKDINISSFTGRKVK